MKIALFLAAFATAVSTAAGAASFRAPRLAAPSVAALEAPLAKSAAPTVDDSGRFRVGDVRDLQKAARIPGWTRVSGGWVSRFSVSSDGAVGLRVQLVFGPLPGRLEVRVQGSSEVEAQSVDPREGPDAWTPWTEGDAQVVEIFSDVLPASDAVRVGSIGHFVSSPLAKAAGSCTVPVRCETGDAVLDSAIATAKKSVMLIQFADGGLFTCTATLIDTPQRPSPFVMTANHCIGHADAARSITSFWFYENAGCEAASPTTRTQVAGGMQLVFGNHNVDSSLLLMNGMPPADAVFSSVSEAPLSVGERIVNISHPLGDAARLALGTKIAEYRLDHRPQDFNAVRFSRGIIQVGSSGSAAFTLSSGQLVFRGPLLGTTIRQAGGMSCTNADEEALYGRYDIFAPQIAHYISAGTVAPDDAANRPQDLAAEIASIIDIQGPIARDGLRIDYAGDMDTFKFTLSQPAVVSVRTEGANIDTVGSLLDARGAWLESNDDAEQSSNHFGLTRALQAGSYYVQVGHFDRDGTGPYNLRIRADSVSATNFTDLWSNPAENGWGLSLNHQGNTLFGALYTYDEGGVPMWLVMSNGDRQPDGSYQGALLRGTGAAFNGPWRASVLNTVGTMRLTFGDADNGTLTYTYNGVTVTKPISRFVFKERNACSWSAFDRSHDENFQDLWLDEAEPGWGLNLAHQGDTMFAALYTYGATGRDQWFVMSGGTKVGNRTYQGALYRTSGPPFNAAPWVPAVPQQVGTMTVAFTNGKTGTVTYTVDGSTVSKPITRYVFGSVRPACDS